MRRLLLPLLALVAAGGTTYGARELLRKDDPRPGAQATAPARPATKAVLVAARDLAVGEFIQPDGVRWQQWPDVTVPDSYYVEGTRGIDEAVGAVLRRPTAAGEPVTQGNLVKPGDRGFLAAVLDPGQRAISVPVDDTSSNAGLIFPGDKVDLILTQSLRGEEKSEEQPRRVSETVLQNIRVLAMGRRLRTEEDDQSSGGQIRTVTLEVTPADAEKVALTTELGKLALSLRSLARADDRSGAGPGKARVTWDADVSPVLRPENQVRTTMAVIRGPEAQTIAIRRGVVR